MSTPEAVKKTPDLKLDRERVVFVGASIAALTTALFLIKDGFEGEVYLIEKDELPDGPQIRKGAAQADHTHVFSAGGWAVLKEVIPELDALIEKAGGQKIEWGSDDARVIFPNGELTQTESLGFETWSASRALFEHIIRQQVRAKAEETGRVRFVTGAEVTGLGMSPDNKAVDSVKFRYSATSTLEQEFAADHVVIASGATGKWVEWVEQAGYSVPAEEKVDANLTYMSADFSGIQMEEVMLGVAESLEHPKAMVISKIEGEVYRVTIFEYGFQGKPPKTQEEFVALALEANPIAGQILATGTLVKDPHSSKSGIHFYENCASRRRPIWDAKHWPEDLFVIGDGVVRLNPRYGTGMSVGVLEARALSQMITHGVPVAKFNQILKAIIELPLQMASGADGRHMRHAHNPNAPQLGLKDKIAIRYLGELEKLLGVDPEITKVLLQLSNFVVPPQALFGKGVLKGLAKSKLHL
jgi:2-polyprenyl-6-methoxyphenol hydroxylase-like FAD-dependent oxidoreductase